MRRAPAILSAVTPLQLGSLLALLPIAVWLPSLGASFQFDDWPVAFADPRVQTFGAWWASMPGIRPLLKATYALNHTLGGHVAAFRLFNLLLHAVNTALLFALVRRLARNGRIAGPRDSTLAAALVALVFALHPVQTESVTYIVGRSNLLAATGSLTAILLWLCRGPTWQGRLALGGSLLALLAAMAGKETAAITPAAMFLCAQLERPGEPGANLRAALLPAAIVILALAAAWWWTTYDYLLDTSLATRTPMANLALQIDAIPYLFGQLWRWDRLNVDPMLEVSSGLPWFLRALLIKAALVAGIGLLRRQPAIAFGLLWFFVWILPTNSVFARLDPVNDRQLYLAIAGPAWLLALLLLRFPVVTVPAAALIALTLAVGTGLRNRIYADEVSFWTDVTLKAPRNVRAFNNLGMAHARRCERNAAADAFESAIRLAPRDTRPMVNLELLRAGELPGVPANCVEAVTVAPAR